MNVADTRTSVHLTRDQREYVEARRRVIADETGLRVGLADVIREAIELLREHKPVQSDEPAETAA